MMVIYGLANCDSTKAAMKWLKANGLPFHFHDLKAEGITAGKLREWLQEIPLDKLLNKKSTTWRSLAQVEQSSANSPQGAILLMQEYTSLIKRPLVEWNKNSITSGFDEAVFRSRSGVKQLK